MREVALAVLAGLLMVVGLGGGLLTLFAAPTAARWNDTKGPQWVRDWHGPAYPGRTKPWHMRLVSVLLIPTGVLGAVMFYGAVTGQL